MIRIKLPLLPPTVNESYRRSATSFYKSKEAKGLFEQIQWMMKSQYKGKPLEGDVSVSINFYIKNKRRDIDGSIKAALDCGNGILYKDDCQVTQLHVFKLVGDDTCELIIEG